MDFIDNKSDLMKALEESHKRIDALRKLPEYDEFLKYRNELNLFADFINNKRMHEAIKFLRELVEDEDKLMIFLDRIKKLEDRLHDIQWKQGFTGGCSNIMDFVFETIAKHCEEAPVTSTFGNGAFVIGKYTIEMYSGQGEHGYSIYKQERIY